MLVLFLGLVGQAHLPPDRAGRRPRRTIPATSACSSATTRRPRGLILIVRRRRARRVDADRRRPRADPRLPTRDRAAVRARRRLPVGELRQHRRRSGVQRRARRPRLRHRASTTSATSSAGKRHARQRRAHAVDARRSSSRPTQLAGRRGSVVVLDVRSGAIVAAYSNPTYRPEPAREPRHEASRATYFTAAERGARPSPRSQRAWREIYPPGSTFKVVTTGIGLESVLTPEGGAPYRLTVDNPVYPELRELELPLTDRTLRNFGGSECGGTLAQSFRVSCNTTFGQIGLDLGEQLARASSTSASTRRPPDSDLRPERRAQRRTRARDVRDRSSLCSRKPAIGQGDGRGHAARDGDGRASRVANGGVMMVPHVLGHVEQQRRRRTSAARATTSREYRRAMEPTTATTVRDLMVDVVNNGTGTRRADPGHPGRGQDRHRAGGGRGPARVVHRVRAGRQRPCTRSRCSSRTAATSASEATGGRVAAPIAAAVLGGLLGAG